MLLYLLFLGEGSEKSSLPRPSRRSSNRRRPRNTEENLSQGFLNTQRVNSDGYTILLVGETGTGKTSLLSLFANILAGRRHGHYTLVHDQANEAGGGEEQSQTQVAKLYKFRSKNGIKLRILDTPGLGDTRGIEQDEEHKKTIARAIEKSIPLVTAVVILANGTVPRLNVSTEYALGSLSSMFGGTLTQSIAILFTNVQDQLARNFREDSLPEVLRGSNYHPFWINNPVALWKKYQTMRSAGTADNEMEDVIRKSHERGVAELVRFFDWLDSLEPQSTRDISNMGEVTR